MDHYRAVIERLLMSARDLVDDVHVKEIHLDELRSAIQHRKAGLPLRELRPHMPGELVAVGERINALLADADSECSADEVHGLEQLVEDRLPNF